MWIISCFLLIAGTVAAVCGISFFIRNREASGRMRVYIFLYGVCSAVWCLFFGLIGLCDNMELCYLLRKAGVIGVVTFLMTETFLITDISGIGKRVAGVLKRRMKQMKRKRSWSLPR